MGVPIARNNNNTCSLFRFVASLPLNALKPQEPSVSFLNFSSGFDLFVSSAVIISPAALFWPQGEFPNYRIIFECVCLIDAMPYGNTWLGIGTEKKRDERPNYKGNYQRLNALEEDRRQQKESGWRQVLQQTTNFILKNTLRNQNPWRTLKTTWTVIIFIIVDRARPTRKTK